LKKERLSPTNRCESLVGSGVEIESELMTTMEEHSVEIYGLKVKGIVMDGLVWYAAAGLCESLQTTLPVETLMQGWPATQHMQSANGTHYVQRAGLLRVIAHSNSEKAATILSSISLGLAQLDGAETVVRGAERNKQAQEAERQKQLQAEEAGAEYWGVVNVLCCVDTLCFVYS
jgi:hypothetical protein